MKTSLAFIAMGVGILAYIYGAVTTHALSLYSNRPSIVTGVLVGGAFIALGIVSYLFG